MSEQLTKKVAWMIIKKKLIKFQDSDDTFEVSDNVMKKSDFVKFPIKKNDSVTVSIEDDKVTFLRKENAQKSTEKKETKKDEAKTETAKKESPVSSSSEKTINIVAVAGNKKVIKCEEIDGWVNVSTNLQEKDYKEIGLSARSVVKVKIENDEIVSCSKIEQSKEEKKATASDKKTYSKSNYQSNDARQQSIEAQACVNSACVIVSQLVGATGGKATSEQINKMKKAIAEDSFKLIQELKSK